MGDSLITVIAIFLAAILMFVFPLMSLSERTDNISQLAVQTATTEFVDRIKTTGKLNSFETDILIQQLDENPGVKTTQAETTKIGENVYYNMYTSQVEEKLNSKGRITLKEGDIVSVTVRNTNQTIAQLLRNFFYMVSGDDTYQIEAQHSGVVTVNGSTNSK